MGSQNKDMTRGDSDSNFLDDVLNKLYDFGDRARGKKKCKKNKQPKADAAGEEELGTTSKCIDENYGALFSQTGPKVTLAPDVCKIECAAITLPSSQVETVVFQDTLKRKTEAKITEIKLSTAKEKVSQDRTNLEKARLEVHRFGITGFQKEQRRQFEQERAVMLGAKPPKKEHVNYKVYQQMIKEKKLKEREEMKSDTKKKKKQGKDRDKKRKSSSNMLPTGQIGQFRNGVLLLSSKEIQTIKNSRVLK